MQRINTTNICTRKLLITCTAPPQSPQKWSEWLHQNPGASWAFKKGKSHSFGGTARQYDSPSEAPSLASFGAQVCWLASCLGFGQTAEELLSRPTPPTIATEDDQLGPPVASCSSGYVASLRRWAAKDAPSTVAHLVRTEPSRFRTETMVVSTSNWAPMKRGKPSATISSLRLSRTLGRARSGH